MEKISFYYNYTAKSRTAFAYFPDILKEISKAYKLFLKKRLLNDEWIADNTDEFNQELKLDLSDENEFLMGQNVQIRFKFKLEDNCKVISLIEINEVWGLIALTIFYDKEFNYEEWENNFSERLLLEKASADEVEENHSSLPSINKKIVKIDRKLNEILESQKKIKKIFVSMRFDDHSKSVAFDLNKFFALLNLEMITGMGVEPRSITEKVEDRIENSIDLFIILLTKSGSSDWINQEIGFAKAKKLPILILKEYKANTTNPGMLRDNEYIEFRKISEVYIGILETVRYLEDLR
jgi:hypothetical protein